MPKIDLAKLTAVVHSCNRPKSLRRLVRSVRRHYPQLRLLAADDSMEPHTPRGLECLHLPSNSGSSACLNALLSRVRTPYFLLLENLAELHRGTRIEHLLQMLVDDKLDVAAGDVVECRRRLFVFTRRLPSPQHGLFEFTGNRLTLRRGTRSRGEGYWWCDLVSNFYVARTSKIRTIGGWDPELRNDQREELFVRAHRHGLRVGVVPEVTIWHWLDDLESPTAVENQSELSLAVAKMGLERMTDFTGRIVKAPRRVTAA